MLNFWVYNDYTEESHEKIRLKIDRATGEGRTRPPSTTADGYSLDITVVDNDQCAVGGGMTIGDSRADHFHTVGLDDMTNANVTAATVRISSGYDSSTDRLLIDGITPTTAVNITTYSGGSVTYNGTSYNNITSKFYTNQGVLEISRASALPAPAMVKFFNESVFFQSTATGNTARSATFTLGDAQAWDMHEDGTTHYYRFVPGTLIHFDTANTAAASNAKSYFGVKGYLATVTSRAENTFLGEKFNVNGGPPAGWLGGWDNGTEGRWEWMNGPEKGRRFLSANTVLGNNNRYHVVHGTGNGAGTASDGSNANPHTSVVTETQTVELNGSDHATDSWSIGNSIYDDFLNMRFDRYRENIVNGRVNHLPDNTNLHDTNNIYRFANFSYGEPNDAGGDEDKLQMTGNSVGGRLWNDLPGNLNTITGDYAALTSPYRVSGYYQEFGGPLKSEWGFYNRKFSQTNNFTTGACNVTKSSENVGLKSTSCVAWSDLTIGTDSDNSEGFDFYGPNNDVNNHSIKAGRVSISSGYVSGTDSLRIAGQPLHSSSSNSQKKYQNFSIEHSGTTYSGMNATFFVNEGVMEISKSSGTLPANAMVQLFNEKVELVIDPPGNTNVGTAERQVTYTLGEAQAWFGHPDGGDRYYRYITGNHSWTTARDRAEDSTREYFGVQGYLATITSHAENQILAQKFNDNGGPPSGWLGGNDNQTEGEWRWMRGPERYMRFWKNNGSNGRHITGSFVSATSSTHQGTDNTTSKSCVAQDATWNNNTSPASGHTKRLNWGYSETLNNGVPSPSGNKRFSFWSCASSTDGTNKMEPNNSGPENFLQMQGSAAGGGMWNDLPLSPGSTGTYGVKGYYVEYGGPSTWAHNFSDRKLGQTMRINPQECALVRVD